MVSEYDRSCLFLCAGMVNGDTWCPNMSPSPKYGGLGKKIYVERLVPKYEPVPQIRGGGYGELFDLFISGPNHTNDSKNVYVY